MCGCQHIIGQQKWNPNACREVYDGPNGSLFISILLHNFEFRIPKFALRISEFGIVKYM